ncbi:MAG TPA: TetR/AcrR family transcriptional regulator [Acidimicrobiales bacterium]|nr:TetR/AcrR family transcriptional regulator [Acidimicrobiales bacterium]
MTSVSPPGPRREPTPRRLRTRSALLDAAARLWADRGFWQITVEDVCTAAGFTRGAFYSNFDSLDELFLALWGRRTDDVNAEVACALAAPAGETSIDDLIAAVVGVLPLDRDWARLRAEYLAHAARRPDVAERVAEGRQLLLDAVVAHLDAAIPPLSLPGPLRRPPDAADAILLAVDGVLTRLALDGDEAAARRRLVRQLHALLG